VSLFVLHVLQGFDDVARSLIVVLFEWVKGRSMWVGWGIRLKGRLQVWVSEGGEDRIVV